MRFLSNLERYELPIVGCCVAATFVSDRFLLPAAIIIGLLTLFRVASQRKFLRSPADLGVLGLIIMACITMIASPLLQITFPQVLRLMIGIGLFYAILNWDSSANELKRLYPIIVVFGFLLAVYGLVNTDWITNKIPFVPGSLYLKLPQVATDTIHPSVLGNNLVILLPIIIAIPLFGGKDHSVSFLALSILASLFIFTVLLISQTRGSLLALGSACAVLIALRWKRGIIVDLILAFTAILFLIYLTYANSGYSQLLLTDSPEKLSGRIEIWSRAIYMIKDFPFTGVGMGLYGKMVDALYPVFLNAPSSVPHSHNLFLQIGVDLGIPGIISWLSIFLVVIFSSLSIYKTSEKSLWLRGLGAGMLASQVAIIVNGITDSVVWGMVKPAPILWGVWGLAIAAWIKLTSEKIHGINQQN